MKNGSIISEEIRVADAHPSGKRPFKRQEYIEKFKTLTDGIISKNESTRFLNLSQRLKRLNSKELKGLNIEVNLKKNRLKRSRNTIF